MAVIGQWTTPTTTFHVSNADFTQASEVIVTFKQREYKLDKTAVVVDDENVSVYLSQEETGRFMSGEVRAQINWTFTGARRAMTYEVRFNVIDNLKDGLL